MSNNTARLARQLAEGANPDNLTDTAKAAREHILSTTDPLTMADVDWDDEKHHLAGATLPSGYEVVMMWPDDSMDKIDTDKGTFRRGRLTPNGKHYELREIGTPEQPAHPTTLETVEDYVNAPVGTIVDIDEVVSVRGVYGWYFSGYEDRNSSEYMARLGEGDVIRWGGWGE